MKFLGKCPKGWKSFTSNCYKLLDGNFNWNEAVDKCEEYGSSLASVHSSQENDFIHKMTQDVVHAWIGGENYKTWMWRDGTKWTYTNWYANEPSGDGNCLEMYKKWNGKWNDKPCHYKIRAVCKKSK